jgi:hypothetical protein
MGVECYWETVKCLFRGMKSELRFKFRHMADVSHRVLRHVAGLFRLPLQHLELLRDGIGAEIEVGCVPGRNTGSQDDRLR